MINALRFQFDIGFGLFYITNSRIAEGLPTPPDRFLFPGACAKWDKTKEQFNGTYKDAAAHRSSAAPNASKRTGASGYLVAAGARSSPPQWK